MSTTKPIGGLLPWLGAKRALAIAIAKEMGPHRTYWEPFCGSMAVLLRKTPCSMETANDLHGDLTNLARVMKDDVMGPQLYRRLRRTLFCRDLWAEAAEELKTPSLAPLDRAYAFFVYEWAGMNGAAGSRQGHTFAVRHSNSGGNPALRFRRAVESIPHWRRCLRDVIILRQCGLQLCEQIADHPGTVIYADPPYVEKGAEYLHDFSAEDHERLARALRRFKRARVIVSYYDHPLVRDLYDGWTVRPLTKLRQMVLTGRPGRPTSIAPEMLLINGPSLDQPALFA